jgi:outer membrane autotransporter protein
MGNHSFTHAGFRCSSFCSHPEDAFMNALYAMGSAGEIAQAALSSTPFGTTQARSITRLLHRSIGGVINERQIGLRGFSAGGDISAHNESVDDTLWMQPFATYGEQDGKGAIPGFDMRIKGLVFGGERRYSDDSSFGLALALSHGDTDSDLISQDNDINAYSITAYGVEPLRDWGIDLFWQAGATIESVNTSRYIPAAGLSASGDYTSKSFHAKARAAKTYRISDSLEIMPGVSAEYIYYDSPSYSETGAGGLNLNVEGFEDHYLIMGVESEFRYEMGPSLYLLGSLGVDYDLINKDNSVRASYAGMGGTMFDTNGIENDRWGYKAGIGILSESDSGFKLDIRYDLQGEGNDFINHVISAKASWKF